MADIIPMQTVHCSNLDQSKLCSFDLEVMNAPTTPLIHQSARFLFINSGKGTIKIQNCRYDLSPGAMVAILPWQITEVVEVDTPLQYYIVIYQFDTINQIIKSFYNIENDELHLVREITGEPVVYCDQTQKETIEGVFLTVRNEVGIESTMALSDTTYMRGIYLTSTLIELMVLHLRVGRESPCIGSTRKLSVDRSEILQYMYNHLSEKLTLKRLSQIFYMSESAISQYIARMTGLSFFDLLNEMRVGKTISFLLYTDMTLEELAEILGYVDSSHISKVFSARIGMKANEYRKTYQRVSDVCKVKESRKAYSIINHLYRNYSEPLTAQSVAAQFSVSVQEMQRMLLYQVEHNFEDFLHLIRVNRASELLLTTSKSIIDIAVEVGYRSAKTLTRNFLRLRVMTPGEFRKTVSLQPNLDEGSCGGYDE